MDTTREMSTPKVRRALEAMNGNQQMRKTKMTSAIDRVVFTSFPEKNDLVLSFCLNAVRDLSRWFNWQLGGNQLCVVSITIELETARYGHSLAPSIESFFLGSFCLSVDFCKQLLLLPDSLHFYKINKPEAEADQFEERINWDHVFFFSMSKAGQTGLRTVRRILLDVRA